MRARYGHRLVRGPGLHRNALGRLDGLAVCDTQTGLLQRSTSTPLHAVDDPAEVCRRCWGDPAVEQTLRELCAAKGLAWQERPNGTVRHYRPLVRGPGNLGSVERITLDVMIASGDVEHRMICEHGTHGLVMLSGTSL